MAESGFYKLGRKAGSAFNHAKWVWQSRRQRGGRHTGRIRCRPVTWRRPFASGACATTTRSSRPCWTRSAISLRVSSGTSSTASTSRSSSRSSQPRSRSREGSSSSPGGSSSCASAIVTELAFVVAHEMSHVIPSSRHRPGAPAEGALRGVDGLTGRGCSGSGSARSVWSGSSARIPGRRARGRRAGGPADTAAGFDSGGATRLLERFKTLEQGPRVTRARTYLSTHPPVDERIASLRESS